MPVTTPAAVREQIKSGTTDPAYLLFGDDAIETAALAAEFDGLVEEELRGFNVSLIHLGETTTGDELESKVGDIVEAARTLPMLAPRRVVTVLHAEVLLTPKRQSEAAARALAQIEGLLSKLEPSATLVFVSASLDKRTRIYKQFVKCATIVECGSPEDVAGAERWVRTRVAAAGVDIDPAGARLIAQLAGYPLHADPRQDHGDMGRLRREVDQLLLYALGQKRISVDDVRLVVGPAALQNDWAMTNAIESGQTGEALRQLALMIETGSAPVKILGQLSWLVRAKFPSIAPDAVRRAVEALFRTDLDLKRSAGDPRVLLERLVVELCAGKRARGQAPRRY